MRELTKIHPHGVFLRRDAIGHGYLDRDLRRAVVAGDLVRIRHGAYVDTDMWRDLDSTGRHKLASYAVLLTHNVPVALSHASGAALHGMRLWGTDLDRVHVTRIGAVASRKQHDVAYHDAPANHAIGCVTGIPVLPPAECALGAASLASVESGVVVLDSAYDLGLCDEADLRAAFERMSGWPGTARLQVTLRLAEAGSQSVGESRARFLFWEQGLPRPVLQYPVYDGADLVGNTDFAWPERGVLGEFDGKVKYGALVRPGDTPSDVVFREKVREDRIRQLTGWRFIRLTWSDLERRDQTARRMRQMLAI